MLEDADLTKKEVDEIVLVRKPFWNLILVQTNCWSTWSDLKLFQVGGSTRIPKVQSLVKEFFNGKEPSR